MAGGVVTRPWSFPRSSSTRPLPLSQYRVILEDFDYGRPGARDGGIRIAAFESIEVVNTSGLTKTLVLSSRLGRNALI